MKFSTTLVSGVLVLIAAFVIATEAGYRHNSYGQSQGAARYNGGRGQALAHYGGGGCHGHNCNRAVRYGGASNSHGATNFGPYHSYAVRPAVYGGHGLYTYRGYARHPPAPRGHNKRARRYRAPRSHRGHRSNGNNKYNRNHRNPYRSLASYSSASNYNNNNNNQYGNLQHNIGGQNYLLKPVKALVLTPQAYNNHIKNSNSNYNSSNNGNNYGRNNGDSYARPAADAHQAAGQYDSHAASSYSNSNANNNYQNHNQAGHHQQNNHYGHGNGQVGSSGGY